MTGIGIITGHPTKPPMRLWGRYTKEIILSEKNPFALTLVRVPFYDAQLSAMPPKKVEKILSKAEGLLDAEAARNRVLSHSFDGFCDKRQQKLEKLARYAFLSVAHLCVRRVAENCGINLMDAGVCIRDSKSERISETLMERLCFDTKSLVLCTKATERGREICEEFFLNTGMAVPVAEQFRESRADVVIDVDKGEVRFGRTVTVDGVLLDFELGDAEVDSLMIAACLKRVNISDRILSYISGKKKLTL